MRRKTARKLTTLALVAVGIGVFGVPDLLEQEQHSEQRPQSRSSQRVERKGGQSCRWSPNVVRVRLSARRYPQAAAHIRDSIAAGHPQVLHINRDRAAINRKHSLKNIRTKRGFDRDEYPPASTSEGGRGAHVRYLNPSQNRGAGAIYRKQLASFCDGQAFSFQIT